MYRLWTQYLWDCLKLQFAKWVHRKLTPTCMTPPTPTLPSSSVLQMPEMLEAWGNFILASSSDGYTDMLPRGKASMRLEPSNWSLKSPVGSLWYLDTDIPCICTGTITNPAIWMSDSEEPNPGCRAVHTSGWLPASFPLPFHMASATDKVWSLSHILHGAWWCKIQLLCCSFLSLSPLPGSH